MKTRIYRRHLPSTEQKRNLRQLVATFPTGMEKEAAASLTLFQENALTYHYEAEIEPAPRTGSTHTGRENLADLQVDLTAARPSRRPLSFQMTWFVNNTTGKCECLAFHAMYGAVRGNVSNSPEGRNLFLQRVKDVWPNADLAK